MKSMTGYAYKEVTGENNTISVEIKSYNARFLDLTISLPPYLSRLENELREVAAKHVLRGKVDIYIKIREKNAPVNVEVDTATAKSYAQAIQSVSAELGFTGEIPLALIVSQDGVLTLQRTTDIAYYRSVILPIFEQAFTAHTQDRVREGEHLCKDIFSMTSKIEEAAALFERFLPQMENLFADNLRKRFAEFAAEVDEQRIAQETAALLIKYTINEEIVRLKSHLSALKSELDKNHATGRKIDFICQEINREINTVGSKNQIFEVSQAVICAKDALENIREQVRNVE